MKPLEPKAPSDSVIYHKLSKTPAHKKGAKQEPPDARLSAYVRGLAGYTCGRGGANHYLFVVQTNSGTGCKPILVHESTYIGRHRDLYSFVVGAI